MSIFALPIYFWVSISVAQWTVWGIYVILTMFFFVKSFTEYNSALKGDPKNAGDVIGIAAYPFITSVMGIILIILLFVDVNKLHLLWVYPTVALAFEFTIGRRAAYITHPPTPNPLEENQEEEL